MSGVIQKQMVSLTIDGALTAAVASQGTLTMDTQPTDGDTVTVGAKTYTFQDTLTDVDGNVFIGGSLAQAKLNLVAAFDLSGVAGTDYATSMTAHPTVNIAAFVADDAVLTAKTAGTAGDAIATTETFTAVTNVFDAATLGTTTAGVDASTILMPMACDGMFISAYAAVGTAPTGAALIVDAFINGTTMFTTQSNRITVADGASSGSAAAIQITDFVAGDILRLDVEQIGSGTAGSNLTVTMAYKGDTSPG